MNNLFIFGAGVSKQAGAPLMAEFKDYADQLRRSDISGVNEASEAFSDVFAALAELRGIYAKAHRDIDNIESLAASRDG